MMFEASAVKKLVVLPVIAVLAAMSVGCGGVPKPRRTYSEVVDYERMTNEYDPLVSLVYSDGKHKLNEYDTLYLVDFVVDDTDYVTDRQEAGAYARRLRLTLRNLLSDRDLFENVTVSDRYWNSRKPGLLMMFATISVYDKGSGWSRFFFWSGATDFQIECKFIDAATGDTVMELVDRRRHLGNTPFGPNIDTVKDHYVMKLTMKQTLVCMTEFLKKAYDGLPGPGKATSES
jgi:hypothetical protein